MIWLPWTLFSILLALMFVGIILWANQRNSQQKKIQETKKKLSKTQTKLEHLEKELFHEREILSLIQDHMTEGIIVLDDADRIQLINRTAEAWLHIDMNQEGSIFVLTENEDFLQGLRETKKNGDPTRSLHKLLKLDGQYIRTYMNRVQVSGISQTIALLVDVTYNIKSEKMRRDFTANVSHELKTPLTTIRGFGEMFGNGMLTEPTDLMHYGTMIERESERLLFLINDIIRLSEIEEHTEDLTTPVELSVTLQDALQILEPQITRNKIHFESSGSCLLLHSNEGYIRELFINLIDNAIKYNNTEGSVWVKISKSENTAKIVVADNGIGIPLNAQSRIFERFYRVDKSRSKERGGTGLGLSIVKHIVDYHNGTISLRSEIGKGTEITILLPTN